MLTEHGAAVWPKLERIAFIGTPHYGSPAIASYLESHLWGSPLMLLLGRYISRATFRSLWGVLRMLPAPPGVYPGTRAMSPPIGGATKAPSSHPCIDFDMYEAANWRLDMSPDDRVNLQTILDAVASSHERAYRHHMTLDQDRRNRMAVIAGVGYRTIFHLTHHNGPFSLWGHVERTMTRVTGDKHREGDGRVPLASTELESVGETRYVKGKHADLPLMPEVFDDVFRWLGDEPMLLSRTAAGALTSHLGVAASPDDHAAGDDPGYWQDATSSDACSAAVDALETKIDAGTLPEFNSVRLL